MNKDNLGDRVKRYEAAFKPLLTRRMPVIVRVDGKAFHTFTRGCDKPFDKEIMSAMAYATAKTARSIQGFKLAYVQSDEASFLITDYDTLDTSSWFDYEVNKIVSITASLFTYHFNKKWQEQVAHRKVTGVDEIRRVNDSMKMALFDARAFNVPESDWPNVFIWRQQDWERNSIQMIARSHFSQRELNGVNNIGIEMMLLNNDIDPESRNSQQKYGTFINKNGEVFLEKADYAKIVEMAGKLSDD